MDKNKLLDEPSYFVEQFIGVEPFDYQSEFMNHPSDRKIFCAGRRVGKSRTASWLALWRAISYQSAEVLITAKTQRQSMEIFNQIKKEIRNAKKNNDIPESEWGITRSTRTEINFQNGSRIICLPVGRDGSNIRGYGADMLIVDEAAFIEDSIFQEVLAPMLAVGDGDFILLSTPMGKSGYFYQRWDDSEKDEKKWYGKRVETAANPMIDEQFVREQRQSMTTDQFEREYLGKFTQFGNKFFKRSELENCTSDEMVQQQTRESYLGVDLAASGADRSVYVSIDGDGNIFSVESSDSKSLTESANRVRELHAVNDYDTVLVDQTGLGQGPVERLQTELGDIVEGFTFTNEKKQSLYNNLKQELQEGSLSFHHVPNQDNLDEVKMFNQCLSLERSSTRTGKLRIEAPSGGHDDFSDALTLAVHAKSDNYRMHSDKESMVPFNLGSLRG